jgi:hypothetical protein
VVNSENPRKRAIRSRFIFIVLPRAAMPEGYQYARFCVYNFMVT